MRLAFGRWRATLLFLAAILVSPALAGPYVTDTSGIRWNDVGGIRWNDVGGIRWNDVGGIRWNDVGGIRWNDVGDAASTDASALHWSDLTGLRWTDAGALSFDGAGVTGEVSIGLDLLDILATLPDGSEINVIITYFAMPTGVNLANLASRGITGGTLMRRLPIAVVSATKQQIHEIALLPNVRSVYSNPALSLFDQDSAALVGVPEIAGDAELRAPGDLALTGAGVTIAVLDTGVNGLHPDLPDGSKVVENVRLLGSVPTGVGFSPPAAVEGALDTDAVLGHGTFVASVAAGTGAASGGVYAGVAPGAPVLALSAGDLFLLNVLEGFDYILDNQIRFGVRVVNCSWGTVGWFDPDDPVNVATRALYDAGISVVFAAGNHGPSPDTLNPYAVAPWVIGVGSSRKDGVLSSYSSRGVFEELLYHPTIVAPGEGIIGAKAGLVNGVIGTVGVLDPSAGYTVPLLQRLNYTVASGTSFAAPHVAGTIALMLEAVPGLTPGEVRRILQETATPTVLYDRAETGAGRLDAWAAVARALYPARPFGRHVPSWIDERPYRIEHLAPVESLELLPAGESVSFPIAADPGALALDLDLAWGTSGDLLDLDVSVRDASGKEVARSATINGAGLFGRAEGIHLTRGLAGPLTLQVAPKGIALFDEPFYLRRQAARAIRVAYPDLDALSASDRQDVERALFANVVLGRGTQFEPANALTRAELARSLALVAGLPQRVPSSPSFPDVLPVDPGFPYIETIAGGRARRILMDAPVGVNFGPELPVNRLDLAVALVRSLGRESEAILLAGANLDVTDSSSIPSEKAGYVAVALQTQLLCRVPAADGQHFDPGASISRLEASRSLVRLRDLLSGVSDRPPQPPQGRKGRARAIGRRDESDLAERGHPLH